MLQHFQMENGKEFQILSDITEKIAKNCRVIIQHLSEHILRSIKELFTALFF